MSSISVILSQRKAEKMNMASSQLSGIIRLFRYYKKLTESSIRQVSEQDLKRPPGTEMNSISVLMKHISGNMISRWTNFREEDGEKRWRNREEEFTDSFNSPEERMELWENAWSVLFRSLESIGDEELSDIIYIRNEGHTILEAAQRHLAHVAFHTGQIVMITKKYAGKNWEPLTIPKGESEKFNQKKFNRKKSIGFYRDRLNNPDDS